MSDTAATESKSITPASLGFHKPSGEELQRAIHALMRQYDGQRVAMDRRKGGNLEEALRTVCGTDRVVIPGPYEFADALKKTLDFKVWTLFVADNFVIDVFACDTRPLPSRIL